MDRLLQQHELAALAVEDFTYTDGQVVFDLIRQSVEQDAIDAHAFVVQAMPDSLKALLQDLLSMTDNAEVLDDKLLEELLRGIRRLREEAASRTADALPLPAGGGPGNRGSGGRHRLPGRGVKLTHLKRVLDKFDRELTMKRMR